MDPNDRLRELLGTIESARLNFEQWQDRKTQAQLSIDSLVFDLKGWLREREELDAHRASLEEELSKGQEVHDRERDSLQASIRDLSERLSKIMLTLDHVKSENALLKEALRVTKSERDSWQKQGTESLEQLTALRLDHVKHISALEQQLNQSREQVRDHVKRKLLQLFEE